jgi:hypothetical protein
MEARLVSTDAPMEDPEGVEVGRFRALLCDELAAGAGADRPKRA